MRRVVPALFLLLTGCSTTPHGGESTRPAPSAPTAASAPLAASAPAPAAPSASAAPAASLAETPSAAPTASASAEQAPAAPPAVEVKNIGMHIGGGPNDAPTKAPFKRSVEPHFPELARCWAGLAEPSATGDVSLDLRVEKDGGKAKITKTKTTLGDDAFRACLLAVLEKVDFEKPRGGATVVSYSLRFTPKRASP